MISDDDAALEALERLALDFAAAEAERLSALSCAEHLGRLLSESREAALAKAVPCARGLTISAPHGARPHTAGAFAPGKTSLLKEGKENLSAFLPPNIQLDVSSRSLTDTTNADTSKNASFGESCSTPDGWASDAENDKAQLSMLARRLGTLRASCAQHRDCSTELDSELCRTQQAFQERSGMVVALRKRVASLSGARACRRHAVHGVDCKELHEAPLLILQARSDLHRVSCELKQLDVSATKLRSHHVAESQAQQLEEERWKEEMKSAEATAAIERRVEQTELTELTTIRESIKCGTIQANGLRQLESEHAAQLDTL